MSRYESIDIPEFTEAQKINLNKLQEASNGKTTLDDRQELLMLQFLEAAAYNKVSDPAKAVKCYERAIALR